MSHQVAEEDKLFAKNLCQAIDEDPELRILDVRCVTGEDLDRMVSNRRIGGSIVDVVVVIRRGGNNFDVVVVESSAAVREEVIEREVEQMRKFVEYTLKHILSDICSASDASPRQIHYIYHFRKSRYVKTVQILAINQKKIREEMDKLPYKGGERRVEACGIERESIDNVIDVIRNIATGKPKSNKDEH